MKKLADYPLWLSKYCNKPMRSANTWLISQLSRLLQVSPRSASFLCVDQPHSSLSAINR